MKKKVFWKQGTEQIEQKVTASVKLDRCPKGAATWAQNIFSKRL